jgi:hypothetical protein
MFDSIIPYLDIVWLPVAYVLVPKKKRWLSIGCILFCMLLMRMQVEFFVYGGYAYGILPILDYHIFIRGLFIYSLIYIAYIAFARLSPMTNKSLFLAASISVFFLALLVSTVLMVL